MSVCLVLVFAGLIEYATVNVLSRQRICVPAPAAGPPGKPLFGTSLAAAIAASRNRSRPPDQSTVAARLSANSSPRKPSTLPGSVAETPPLLTGARTTKDGGPPGALANSRRSLQLSVGQAKQNLEARLGQVGDFRVLLDDL